MAADANSKPITLVFAVIFLQSPCMAGHAGGCTKSTDPDDADQRSPVSNCTQNASSARQSSVFQPTEIAAPGDRAGTPSALGTLITKSLLPHTEARTRVWSPR